MVLKSLEFKFSDFNIYSWLFSSTFLSLWKLLAHNWTWCVTRASWSAPDLCPAPREKPPCGTSISQVSLLNTQKAWMARIRADWWTSSLTILLDTISQKSFFLISNIIQNYFLLNTTQNNLRILSGMLQVRCFSSSVHLFLGNRSTIGRVKIGRNYFISSGTC